MKRIKLYRSNKYALVDDADHAFLSRFNWYVSKSDSNVYAIALVAGITIPMHRLVSNPKSGEITDHKDQNGLNNQRSNLRNGQRAHNTANRRKFRGVNRYLGVSTKTGRDGTLKYIAMTYQGGSGQYHGTFETEIAAAKARDVAAKAIWGEFAELNFPEGKK